jgi:acyl-[acyl-carrier-protein]-phospholipid O-acyltransferase/long-chain-fatty-acid--[acyl-carrier-protein] ligase
MVNFTAGAANILAGCASAKVKTLITSRGLVEKAKLDKLVLALEESVRIIYLEDVGADVSWGRQTSGADRPPSGVGTPRGS